MEADWRSMLTPGFHTSIDGSYGRYGGEIFYYPNEASPRRYGEGPTRLVTRNSSLGPLYDTFPPMEDPSYEEWRWEEEWKGK